MHVNMALNLQLAPGKRPGEWQRVNKSLLNIQLI